MSALSRLLRVCRLWTALFAAVLIVPLSGRAQIQLGSLSFSTARSSARSLHDEWAIRPASTSAVLTRRLGSARFLGKVGGIAFGGIAEGDNGLVAVDLHYDVTKMDGQRLSVTIRDGVTPRRVAANVYDWQLVPIAKFADSTDISCFTLFGELDNQDEQLEVVANGNRVLNYHAAFRDTLLGLRLMQSDILVVQPDACDLPKVEGKYLTGAGEDLAFKLSANERAFMKVQRVISASPAGFDSYVICDEGQPIRFRVQSGVLELEGFPYWHCWRRKFELGSSYSSPVTRARELLENTMALDRVVLSPAEMRKKWDSLQQQIEALSEEIANRDIEALPELSRALSATVRQNEGINPVVYSALTTTMRFSALFRHVKRENPDGYAQFVNSLKDVRITPPVETPNLMIDPARSARRRAPQ